MASDYSATSSDLLIASGVVANRAAYIIGLTLVPAAAACSVVLQNDPAAAQGVVLAKLVAPANGPSVQLELSQPIEATKGIFGTISGASAAFIVHYSLR